MRLIFIFLLALPLILAAQEKAHPPIVNSPTDLCTGPGRLPTTAQAVCGYFSFIETEVSHCVGPNLPNPTAGCGNQVQTNNSRWYKFHCYQSGNMGFLIVPLDPVTAPTEDYDWEVMNITGHNPNDVYTEELRVTLNLSAVQDTTGCVPTGISDINCSGFTTSPYNQLMNLIAGEDYLMMVNNWTGRPGGYRIDFSGTAVLTDNLPPAITDISVFDCDRSRIKVTFSEDILCNTISPTGSEFIISNGPHTITGIVSDCSLGANSVPYVIINLQTPLVPGPYTLSVIKGDDGNTFKSVCQLEMPETADIPFTVATPIVLAITSVDFGSCAPTTLGINFSHSFLCSSATSTGSEFFITPGNPAIASVTYSCNADTTTSLAIHLQNPLVYGNYVLNVQNGSDGNTFINGCLEMPNRYSFPFVVTQATATPPIIQSVDFNECYPTKVIMNFNKPIFCSTVAGDGSDFSVTPGTNSVIGAMPICGANIFTTHVMLTLANNLPAGNFAVNINTGTDGNTVSDTCYNFITPGVAKAFVTTQSPAPIFDSVQYEKCTPSQIKVFYNHAIFCSSIAADGSDFSITGPSAVTVTGATADVTCASGYTNRVTLQLSEPVTTFGTYALHNQVGRDGNGVIDTCSAAQNVANTISFDVLGLPPTAFTSLVKWGCEMDTIIFTHPGNNGITAWHWEFSDGTTADGQTVTHTFPIATLTVHAKLTVSNGYCEDLSSQDIALGNTFAALFSYSPDTACVNLPVTVLDQSTGTGLQFLWNFDDAYSFNGQAPPPHVYATAGYHQIDLVVTDNHGCAATASHKALITLASVDFTGLRAQYCAGNEVSLKGNFSRYIDSVRWDNGNGLTVANKIYMEFSYLTEGSYTISLTGYDKYCGTVNISKTIPVYTIPIVELGRDTVLCPGVDMQIGVPGNPAYTYLWSTGARTPEISTDIFTRKYILVADNHGCSARDDISIKLLPSCLIKVPNAFTPNGDGLNDKLKAINADLARSFSFRVFNRFGQLMFGTVNPLEGWDGKFEGNKADNGAYVWELHYINPWTNKRVSETGTSILLR